MPPERRRDDPREWLRLAYEDLTLAEARVPGVGFGLLCFHAQQAAEKAVKAALTSQGIPFPYVHDIGRLLDLVRSAEVMIPPDVADADLLTDYSTLGRYPGPIEIDESDYRRAVTTARSVLAWSESLLAD